MEARLALGETYEEQQRNDSITSDDYNSPVQNFVSRRTVLPSKIPGRNSLR